MQFNLTDKELKAAMLLVQSCLHGMGGKRPSDLEHDEYTWIDGKDLMQHGYSKNEAGGLFSSLQEKGFIGEYDKGEMIVMTKGWKWLDTVWDANQHLLTNKAA